MSDIITKQGKLTYLPQTCKGYGREALSPPINKILEIILNSGFDVRMNRGYAPGGGAHGYYPSRAMDIVPSLAEWDFTDVEVTLKFAREILEMDIAKIRLGVYRYPACYSPYFFHIDNLPVKISHCWGRIWAGDNKLYSKEIYLYPWMCGLDGDDYESFITLYYELQPLFRSLVKNYFAKGGSNHNFFEYLKELNLV